MSSVRRAVIDVGTNSIKLLVAEVDGRDVRPLCEESRQTRLGRGFYPDQKLQPGPIEESAKAVAEFASKAIAMGTSRPRVVATSATREARNQTELVQAIERASGLNVRVISGEEEAGYAFQGVTGDPRLATDPVLLLDVGGGSTEFILGRQNQKQLAQSYPLGTVRLLEALKPGDAPGGDQLEKCRAWLRHFLEKGISTKLVSTLKEQIGTQSAARSVRLVGTGGTASILAGMEAKISSFDRIRIEATVLSRQRLHWHAEYLWGLNSAERRSVIGLPSNRADVILTGSAIYDAIMDYFDFQELWVSTRGLRFAILMDEDEVLGDHSATPRSPR